MLAVAPLISEYDGVLTDLDGVVYAGPHAISGAVGALNSALNAGLKVGYVTNNASRSAQAVAEHLSELGLRATADAVFGSAWAGVQLLREQQPTGGTVLVVGSQYLADLVREAGYTVTRSAEANVAAVIQGFDQSIGWKDLAQAAFALANGATWVATNRDLTIPLEGGIAPGNGSLVAAVVNAVGREPLVAGKPEPALFRLAARSLNVQRPIVFGDRLDTDIEGGNRAGMHTALVLTGINSGYDALVAEPAQRPHYLLATLNDVHSPYVAPVRAAEGNEDVYRCGDDWALVQGSTLLVSAPLASTVEVDRAACAAWWAAHPDEADSPETIEVRELVARR